MEIILLAALGAFLGLKAYNHPKETTEYLEGIYGLIKILAIFIFGLLIIGSMVYLIYLFASK